MEAWSNDACLGLAIISAQKAAMTDAEIAKLVRIMRSQFDWKTAEEAEEAYEKSEY